jgi:hypothetical protein
MVFFELLFWNKEDDFVKLFQVSIQFGLLIISSIVLEKF